MSFSSGMGKRSTASSSSLQNEEPGSRIQSPSPSMRHISLTRVNQRPFNSKIEYKSIYQDENLPLNVGKRLNFVETGELDSIVYPNNTEHLDRHQHDHNNEEDPHMLEYHPLIDGHVFNWNEWLLLLPYYLPIFSWIGQYNWWFFLGDLIAGLSLVFFQLPLSLSYASSLAHVPVISGLLSLGISPLIYLILGSVPQMIVGPEAAILLIVGQAVEPILHHQKKSSHLDPLLLVVTITFISGATLLGFGLGRFGFLDNVLSGSLLKGFISGVGIIMMINSSVLMLGLDDLLKSIADDPSDMDFHSPFDKLRFLFEEYSKYDPLTLKISTVAFLFLIVVSVGKKAVTKAPFKHLEKLIFIPEILIMVIVTSWLCYVSSWNEKNIAVIGKIKGDTDSFTMFNPFAATSFKLTKKLMTSSFLCAMLGFFESTTALKSLGSRYNLPISSNRELVALGSINIIGSIFGALPAFGGYGRSKVNAMSAKTTMLGAIMGICTFLTISYLLDALYYVPLCSLSVISGRIGLLLIEEAPFEVLFHWKTRGYNELITFFVTVITTVFFSMEAGIAVGLIYLLIRVIKHSAMSRIQILGRIPGSNTFVDADINYNLIKSYNACYSNESQQDCPQDNLQGQQLNVFTDDHFTSVNTQMIEEIEGCLIVKIPEPLTFTNTSDLRARLKRVEMYGSTKAHPALKRSRDESMTKYIIFDLRGMSELDSSAAQMLHELITMYKNRGLLSLFVRVSKHIEVRKRLEAAGITKLLIQDLEKANYFKAQEVVNKLPRRDNFDAMNKIPFDLETANDIYDLIESRRFPFFNHISDALKVIDFYEFHNHIGSRQSSLNVDKSVRRSSLPGGVV